MSQQDYSNSGTDTKLSPFNPAFPGGVTPLSDFTPDAGGILLVVIMEMLISLLLTILPI